MVDLYHNAINQPIQALLLPNGFHFFIARLDLFQLEFLLFEHIVEIGELFAESGLADEMLLFVDRRQLSLVFRLARLTR